MSQHLTIHCIIREKNTLARQVIFFLHIPKMVLHGAKRAARISSSIIYLFFSTSPILQGMVIWLFCIGWQLCDYGSTNGWPCPLTNPRAWILICLCTLSSDGTPSTKMPYQFLYWNKGMLQIAMEILLHYTEDILETQSKEPCPSIRLPDWATWKSCSFVCIMHRNLYFHESWLSYLEINLSMGCFKKRKVHVVLFVCIMLLCLKYR